VAILIVALALESYFLYRSQQPPVIAAVPTASVTSIPAFGRQVVTIGVQPTLSAPLTSTPKPPSPTTMPNNVGDLESGPTAAWADVAAPMWEPVASAIHAAAETAAATSQQADRTGPHLSGQIAFPRFDPTRSTYDVYTCRVDGSHCKRVAEEASQPDLLPDGESLVVHSWKPDDKGLILQTLAGERIWRISDGIETARPSVDLQGQTYVYHSRQDADRKARLHRTYAAESRPLKPGADVLLGMSPSWLPDGQIAYSGCIGNACGIILIQDDGTNPRQIAVGGSERNPESSPDGKQIAFMSKRDGNWEIYLVNTDGSGLHRLTEDVANDGLPAWSPDGHHIAFVSDRDGSWAIWVMNPDGSGQRRLFALGGPLEGQVTGAASHETYGWVEERISWGPLP
jgi:WD40 repeat protein